MRGTHVRRTPVVVSIAAIVMLALTATSVAATGASEPVNAGFEDDGSAVPSPAGWKSAGATAADFSEAGGASGGFHLTHWSAAPYEVETYQALTGLPNGWVTLRVAVRRSTGPGEVWIGLEKCGRQPARTQLPVSTSGWLEIVVSAHVQRNSCTIVLHSSAGAGEWAHFDDVRIEPGTAQLSILGGDVSSLTKSEDFGGVYRGANGVPGDAVEILRDHGLNWIRVRAWVDPADGYHDTEELLSMAQRAQDLGLNFLVNLHYSDFWADPGKQWTPTAWEDLSFEELKARFVEYTREIMEALVAQGTPPEMIQIGNEINPGMLWDYAATWTGCSSADDGAGGTRTECHTENWNNLADLLTAGYETVKEVSPETRVMLHLAEGGSSGTFRWWFDNITMREVPFDVIGASYYAYWHGTLAALQYNLNDVAATYGKDVVVAETAYAFTLGDDDGWGNIIWNESQLVPGYPGTPAGQAANLRDVMSIVRAVPDGRGLGVFYWDPTWTGVIGNGWSPRDPSSGNAWENQALFDFDDRPLPAMSEFRP